MLAWRLGTRRRIGWTRFSLAPPTLVAALEPTGDDAFDRDWAVIAAGAIETDRESSDGAVTLWFNPVFDAGLAVRWTRTAQGWTPAAGAPVTGELLRGEPLSRYARSGSLAWPAAAGAMAQSLAAAALRDDRAALAGASPAALDAPAQDRTAWTWVALARVDQAARAMRLMAMRPGYGDAAFQGAPPRWSRPMQPALRRRCSAILAGWARPVSSSCSRSRRCARARTAGLRPPEPGGGRRCLVRALLRPGPGPRGRPRRIYGRAADAAARRLSREDAETMIRRLLAAWARWRAALVALAAPAQATPPPAPILDIIEAFQDRGRPQAR